MVAYVSAECCFDGVMYSFAMQLGNVMGCGPFSVGIAKERLRGAKLTEDAWSQLIETFDVDNTGTDVDNLTELLAQDPAAAYELRNASKIAHMRRASADRPIIVSWQFDNPYNGATGHFNVCIGPTRSRPTELVIFDPGFGLNYVTVPENPDDDDDDQLVYDPVIGLNGNDVVTPVPTAKAHLNKHPERHQSFNIVCIAPE